jgi:hypothetical protein
VNWIELGNKARLFTRTVMIGRLSESLGIKKVSVTSEDESLGPELMDSVSASSTLLQPK